jgi:hypothetical protein
MRADCAILGIFALLIYIRRLTDLPMRMHLTSTALRFCGEWANYTACQGARFPLTLIVYHISGRMSIVKCYKVSHKYLCNLYKSHKTCRGGRSRHGKKKRDAH